MCFFCSTYAEIEALTIDYAIPADLGITPSEKIEELLEGKGPKFLVDGLTAAAHRTFQKCICCMICVLYFLKGDVTAMRIALYDFSSRIPTNPRRPSSAKRCRSPFIIDKRNGTVYLSQDFAFGNILDDCPYTTKHRLYTGVQLGPGWQDKDEFALFQVNDAFHTHDSIITALTYLTTFIDACREVGEEDVCFFAEYRSYRWTHTEKDSSHTCGECKDVVTCQELTEEIGDEAVCEDCVKVEEGD